MQPIRVLTIDFTFLGEIDDYESLQFVRRFHKPGEFELHINVNKNLTETLQEDNLIMLSPRKVGVIRHREMSKDNIENLVIKGYTLQGFLGRRLTVPPSGQGYDKINDSVESVLKHYVRQNATAPSDPNRIIPDLVIAESQNRGTSLSWQSRYVNLVEELETISTTTGIGWDIHLDLEAKKFVYDVYEPRNISASQSSLPPVIFSVDFDNIKNQTFTDSALNHKNFGYVGGKGEEADRRIVEVGSTSGFNRIEEFIDAKDISETETNGDVEVQLSDAEINAALVERGNQKLVDLQKVISFESNVLTYGPFVYEQDWDLGDIVTVQDKKWGLTLDTPIPEIKEVYEVSGFSLEATFGNTVPTIIEKIKKTIKAPMVEKSNANVVTNVSELVNDAGYITAADVQKAQNFIHDQVAASNVWLITHNLGKYPSVNITDSAGSVVMGDIKHIDLNTTELKFSIAFSGRAILI